MGSHWVHAIQCAVARALSITMLRHAIRCPLDAVRRPLQFQVNTSSVQSATTQVQSQPHFTKYTFKAFLLSANTAVQWRCRLQAGGSGYIGYIHGSKTLLSHFGTAPATLLIRQPRVTDGRENNDQREVEGERSVDDDATTLSY